MPKATISGFFCLFTAAVLVFGLPCGTVASPQPVTLSSVNVVFELPWHCDNRDHDTTTKLTVTNGGTTIAENDDVASGIELKDDQYPAHFWGPYNLPQQNTLAKDAWTGTNTNIHIDPNGKDTWCVKFHVDALFSDNTHIKTNNCSVVKISESNRDYTFNTTACSD